MMPRLVSPIQCLLAILLVVSFQAEGYVKAFTAAPFIPLSSSRRGYYDSSAASISLGAGMGMGGSVPKKGKKKKKSSKSSSSNSKGSSSASSFDVNASLLRLEKKFEEMSSEASKAMMSDDEDDKADDMMTADFVLAVRGTDTKQFSAGTSDWVPVAQLALRPHVEVDSEFVSAAISCHCREIHHAATLGAPVFQSVPRNMVEYSVEPLNSWHKNVYDVIQESAPSFQNAQGDTMSKSKAKEILGISQEDDMSSVKSAYRKKSFQLHPDRLVGKSESEIQEAQAEYELVKNAYDRLAVGGIRNASASWYESLGGRGRTDFRLVSLQGINAAKDTLESNRVTCAIAGLDPELVQSFTTRNQAGAVTTKSQQ